MSKRILLSQHHAISSTINPSSSFFFSIKNLRFRRFAATTSQRRKITHDIDNKEGLQIDRNVRYSSMHPRNVLDIYEDTNTTTSAIKIGAKYTGGNDIASKPMVLYIHGGMWLRGDKTQPTLSMYDAISAMFANPRSDGSSSGRSTSSMNDTDENDVNLASSSSKLDSSSDGKDGDETCPSSGNNNISHVGEVIARAGGVACVMNYRLAGDTTQEQATTTTHPHQIMDVARCIAFLLDRLLKTQNAATTTTTATPSPKLYIGGHSAGAHLGALSLSETRWLDQALDERNICKIRAAQCLEGFFGISGVYNLSRLRMDSTAAITIGPAFGGVNGGGVHPNKQEDVVLDASPLHALFRAEKKKTTTTTPPPLATMPVLLLNAESNDFHLNQDSEELLVALQRFDKHNVVDTANHTSSSSSSSTPSCQKRSHVAIPNRNHFSIERSFGKGLLDALIIEPQHKSTDTHESNNGGWWDVNAYLPDVSHYLNRVYESTMDYYTPSSWKEEGAGNDHDVDKTALHVLTFLGLIQMPKSTANIITESTNVVS